MIIKSNKTKGLSRRLWLFSILAVLTAFSFQIVLNPPPGEAKLFIASLLMCVLFPCILLYEGIQLIPGQGDLRLTDQGFQVMTWLTNLRRNYRWTDIAGFYVSNIRNGRAVQERVCFDLACLISSKRRQILTFQYNQSPQELTDLLNEWKEKYAPSQQGVELRPLHDAPVQGASVWKTVGIQLAVIFGLMVATLSYFYFFAKTDIKLINNTKAQIQDIHLSAFTSFPKKAQAFKVRSLLPNQEVTIRVPHFDKGIIRLAYHSNRPVCGYLAREQCVWHSGDTLFLEPDGHFPSKISYCKPKKSNKIDRVLVGQCLANDAQIQQQHYKVAQPILVEPVKIERSAQTAPQTQQKYAAFLQAEIKKHWHPPNLDQPYQNTVSFSIKPDGRLARLKLMKASGSSELDDASLFAVKAAFPLPSLPATLKHKVITTELTFDYKR